MKSNKWYVADFETTSEKFYNEYGYTKVWLYSICDNNNTIVKDGESIEDFMNFVSKTIKKGTIYFHNLKFDGSFILDYLLNNKFTYKDKIDIKKDKNCFTTLIGDMGEFYTIKVCFGGERNITFVDSLKILPFKVKKIAKDFNLPILKGKINYDEYIVNDETLSYIHNDVLIVSMALNIVKKEGLTKLTTASSAYSYYKSTLNSLAFERCFPKLDDDLLIRWREAYRGGRCQVNPMYQDKILHNVKRFDINSMYPSIMYDMFLPYGEPILIDYKDYNNYKFSILHISIGFDLKENSMPSLLKKGGVFDDCSYYISTDGVENIYISNIDFELVKRNYDIWYLDIIEIWGFNTVSFLFKDYVSHFYELKSNSKGAQKSVYKLFLNSLYGKFGSNLMRGGKIPQLNKDNVLSFTNKEETKGRAYYLPIAIAITSYGHKILDDAIHLTGYDNFVYCDTDSIHTLGDLPKDLIDNKKLGKFKLESIEKKSKYVRQKTYIYTDSDDSITITCAGLPEEIKEQVINEYGDKLYSMFTKGFTCKGKLLPMKVKGGVILCETTFKIKQ